MLSFHAPTNSSSHICCMTGRQMNKGRRLYCTFLVVWCVAEESLILVHVPSPLPEGLTNNHKALHAPGGNRCFRARSTCKRTKGERRSSIWGYRTPPCRRWLRHWQQRWHILLLYLDSSNVNKGTGGENKMKIGLLNRQIFVSSSSKNLFQFLIDVSLYSSFKNLMRGWHVPNTAKCNGVCPCSFTGHLFKECP